MCLAVKAALRVHPEVEQKLTNSQHKIGRQTSVQAIFLVFLHISASENPSIFHAQLGEGQRETWIQPVLWHTVHKRISSIRRMKNVEKTVKPGYCYTFSLLQTSVHLKEQCPKIFDFSFSYQRPNSYYLTDGYSRL